MQSTSIQRDVNLVQIDSRLNQRLQHMHDEEANPKTFGKMGTIEELHDSNKSSMTKEEMQQMLVLPHITEGDGVDVGTQVYSSRRQRARATKRNRTRTSTENCNFEESEELSGRGKVILGILFFLALCAALPGIIIYGTDAGTIPPAM